MIPMLFNEYYTDDIINTQGIGPLSDAVSCSVTCELDGKYELEMEYPINGIHANDINIGRVIVAVPGYSIRSQPFRIYMIVKTEAATFEVYAQHISYDVEASTVRPVAANGTSYTSFGLLNVIKNELDHQQIKNTFDIDIGETIVSNHADYNIDTPISGRDALIGNNSVKSNFGGDFYFDRHKIRYYMQYGHDSGLILHEGVNIKTITYKIDTSDTYLGCRVYYKTIDRTGNLYTSKIADSCGAKRIYYYNLTDGITDDEYTNNKLDVFDLATLAGKIVTDYAPYKFAPLISIDTTYVNGEDAYGLKTASPKYFFIGDKVKLYHNPLGIDIDLRIMSTTYDVLLGRYNSIKFGNHSQLFDNRISATISGHKMALSRVKIGSTMYYAYSMDDSLLNAKVHDGLATKWK